MRHSFECLNEACAADFGRNAAEPNWRSTTIESSGWWDVWITQSASVLLHYNFHPISKLLRSEIDSQLLEKWVPMQRNPCDLEADKLSVEVELGPSQARLSGLLVKMIFQFKDNYFGSYDTLTDIQCFECQDVQPKYGKEKGASWLKYRPFEVSVYLVVHNVEACLLFHGLSTDGKVLESVSHPVVYMEQLALEIDKKFEGSLIQVRFENCLLSAK